MFIATSLGIFYKLLCLNQNKLRHLYMLFEINLILYSEMSDLHLTLRKRKSAVLKRTEAIFSGSRIYKTKIKLDNNVHLT